MNETTGGLGCWHRAWPRRAGVLAITAGVMLLAAACGGSPSSTGSGGSSNARGSTPSPSGSSLMLPFARCMRSHDIPNFPDPPGNGKFPSAQQLGVSSSQYQAAEDACQNLLPPGTNDHYPVAEIPILLSGMRKFSQCMRSHGVPNWPDPEVNSLGQPVFPASDVPGLEHHYHLPAQVMAKASECQHLMPSQFHALPLG